MNTPRRGFGFSRFRTFNLDENMHWAAADPGSYHYSMRQRLFGRADIGLVWA
jgi:6-phosphogluconolactonase/glucosamine-6-phosphate isomerase/deaminase